MAAGRLGTSGAKERKIKRVKKSWEGNPSVWGKLSLPDDLAI